MRVDLDQLTSKLGLDREHQMRAVRAALEALLGNGRCGLVLADEVGCGKTYEALAITALLWRHFQGAGPPIQRVLVVAEPALMQKWFDEIEAPPTKGRGFQQYVAGEEWAPFREMLRNVTQLGRRWDGEGRGVREAGKFQVPTGRLYLVKPLLLTDGRGGDASPMVRWLRKTDWDVIIADEAHHFTGLHTERSRVFFPDQTPESRKDGLTGRFLLSLTATPFQLATKEMLNLLRIVLAPEDEVEQIRDGLERYELALEQFYARRRFAPSDEGRRRWVERLHELRTLDASGGQRPGTPGLEELLRRHLIRNVKDHSERDYGLSERSTGGYGVRRFGKLDDLQPIVAQSPLIPLEGDDAWIYLHLRDLLVDAQAAARATEDARLREKPSFVAGDLRQCLSSYEQLAESAVLKKKLPRAEQTRAMVARLSGAGHVHPKIAALCAVVGRIVDREIEALRARPLAGLPKILVFNSLIHTAGALREALSRTVKDRVDPFVEEQVKEAGWTDLEAAREMVREALRQEREEARERLGTAFEQRFLRITQDLLEGTGLEMKAESRELVDVMFDRAENHCTQPLFLLRMALWLKGCGETADAFAVQSFLMKHVGDKLRRSLATIVDDYLDDTPRQGEAFSDENLERARREIARLARVLAHPDYVARFDGAQHGEDRELRRENFNRPYAPLVLLVSRVGEEGIDLQQHTRYVLHYDVEWNPAKMEQREGRVDREGRRTRGPVEVQFFLLKDTYEERVFHTVMQRDAWFQVLIGSKRQELARGMDDDPEAATDLQLGAEERGRITSEERRKVMIDLRP
jgi:ERCC4-related helicase